MARDLSFADRLRARRIECGLSKSGLAREVGVTGTCVWNWEQGNTYPRPEIRATLARALRTTWTFLETGLAQGTESDPALGQEKAPPESLPFASSEIDPDQNGTQRGEEQTPRSSSSTMAPPLRVLTRVNDGERELISGLLSKDTNFRLIVSGPVGVREIERLMEKLEIDKKILAEATAEGGSRHDPYAGGTSPLTLTDQSLLVV